MYDLRCTILNLNRTLYLVKYRDTFHISLVWWNNKGSVTIFLRQPQAILEEMKALDEESAEVLKTISDLID